MLIRLMREQEELIIECPDGEKIIVKLVKIKAKSRSYIGIGASIKYKIRVNKDETDREADRK